QSASTERRTLLGTSERSFCEITAPEGYDARSSVVSNNLEHCGIELSPSSSRSVIPEGKCNPSRNVWWKLVDPSETPPHVS
ncbi:MAG TPA: hypothetical protein VN939_07480, partial [Chthoniobacterales bacterium]|nr:hypothetical protein [Chthoniobacterales bacterium]